MSRPHNKNSESQLMDAFKSAANSVALLYKESLQQSRGSFNTGYNQALQDIWEYISQDMSEPLNRTELVAFLQEKHSQIVNRPTAEDLSLHLPHGNYAQSQANSEVPSSSKYQPEKVDSAILLSPPSSVSQSSNWPPSTAFHPILPMIPENLLQAHDSPHKRRWGFNQSTEGASRMNLDYVVYPEQPVKRTRVKSDRMQEN